MILSWLVEVMFLTSFGGSLPNRDDTRTLLVMTGDRKMQSLGKWAGHFIAQMKGGSVRD